MQVSGFEKEVKNSLGMGKKKTSESNPEDRKADAEYRAAEVFLQNVFLGFFIWY